MDTNVGGVWVCLLMKYFFEFLRASGLSKFSKEHFDEVYVLKKTIYLNGPTDTRNDSFIEKSIQELKIILEDAYLEDEIKFLSPPQL